MAKVKKAAPKKGPVKVAGGKKPVAMKAKAGY